MKKTAIVYDFDKTLSPRDMQEFSLIPSLGYQNAADFWKEVTALSHAQTMDPISAYLYLLQKKFQQQGQPLKRENFAQVGKGIQLYPDVETWFERINAYGKTKGLEVEHYIISSGMAEILEETSIARYFRKIYACRYFYNEAQEAVWPAVIVNYTTKTQYLFRINKQVLDEADEEDLNTWIPFAERAVPFSRIIYIADGMTDVPCMRLVKEYGGRSIAVYDPSSQKAGNTAARLIREGRADFMTAAQYGPGGPMETLVKEILDAMGAESILDDREGKTDGKVIE